MPSFVTAAGTRLGNGKISRAGDATPIGSGSRCWAHHLEGLMHRPAVECFNIAFGPTPFRVTRGGEARRVVSGGIIGAALGRDGVYGQQKGGAATGEGAPEIRIEDSCEFVLTPRD